MKYKYFVILVVLISVIIIAYFINRTQIPKRDSVLVKEIQTYEYDKQRI